MDAIKGYVMCALIASALAGILKNLSSSMKNFEKYVGLVCSLVVVIILSAPLVNIMTEIKEALSENSPPVSDEEISDDTNISGSDVMAGYYIESVENTVADIISDRFSIAREDLKIVAELDEEHALKNIIIYFYTETDTVAVENFTENILCIETEIRSLYDEK